MKRRITIAGQLALLMAMSCAATAEVDFNSEIKPILSDKCFLCHGPDEGSRQADLRLDTRAGLLGAANGTHVVVPGDLEASALAARIASDDPSFRMPPPDAKKQLTPTEVALLRRWIDEGALYSEHWAFVPPVRPELPALSAAGRSWAQNPIDDFVYAQLEQAGLTPSPRADRIMLLRRLHMDLTGLPPTIDEIECFLGDRSEQAYEQLVKKLLASPHYGERWARRWLDAARYADSDGYEKDLQRSVWFWRDWVIDAFNTDKPYDEFIIEQIAGDMLPDAGQQERVATGFLRNSMVNEEGGADPEQFRVEALFDRMDAIGKAILGLTTQCAQCHSHKYDPLTHADYYGMFAFFNSCEEADVVAYTPEQEVQRGKILQSVEEIEQQLRHETPDWQEQLAAWARELQEDQPQWIVFRPTDLPWDGQKFRMLDDGSILSESYAPPQCAPEFGGSVSSTGITGIRVELLMHPQLPGGGPGRSHIGTGALTELKVFVQPADRAQPRREVKLAQASADVNPERTALEAPFFKSDVKEGDKRVTGPVEFAIDGDTATAWTTDSGPATRHQARKAVFIPAEPIGGENGTILTIQLNQSHGGPVPDQKQNYLMGRFRLSYTTAAEPSADPLPARVRQLVDDKDPKDWSDAEFDLAFSYWRTTVPEWAAANEKINQLLANFPQGTHQLVAEERAEPRVSHRLERGDFLQPKEVVAPHVPGFLHSLPENEPRNRLGFARWLVDRKSPTTARTIVNRMWQAYFGTGIVETPEDLGSQSPPPSHPELLDWLAVEFMDNDWSFKHLHRLITGSATYQQSSRVSPELLEIDPQNRLLARGPRLRVEAEVVRDIALAASGLLDERIGGPSVYPPAPDFLFQPPVSYGPKYWATDTDGDQYRRSMYMHAYRSVPYPPLSAFDAPKGDAACVRRSRSNTPLQALVMLNETQFVECSRAMAARVCREVQGDDQARIRLAFRLSLTRPPEEEEVAILAELLETTRQRIADDELNCPAVLGLAADKSDAKRDTARDDELASWTLVCRAILNLDETITKQ